jgi:hypothetical protein
LTNGQPNPLMEENWLPMTIKWWEKSGWKIKFYPNKNIEWHCIQLNFNSIQFYSIQFNLLSFQIQLSSKTLNVIQISLELNLNSIEFKFDKFNLIELKFN